MSDDKSLDTPQISRSGRVLKKSAKVKEMEDFDISGFDVSVSVQGAGKKMEKISIPPNKSLRQVLEQSFQALEGGKFDIRRAIYPESSDGSKTSDSSSVSSETSSSPLSSDLSDDEVVPIIPYTTEYKNDRKVITFGVNPRSLPIHQKKVIVQHNHQRYEPPAYLEQPSSETLSSTSEDAGSDTALVIAEDSDESINYRPKVQRGNVGKKKVVVKKNPPYGPRQGGTKRKAPVKSTNTAAKKRKPPAKPKPLSGYMLWCSENRKKITATVGNIGFSNIGKKMGEAWQALSEKEKMAWRRKAKRLAMKTTGNIINTGAANTMQNKSAYKPAYKPVNKPANKSVNKPASKSANKSANKTAVSITEDLLKGFAESAFLGTAPIDAAAHLKLLGDSLTVIGQRLIEHEGQLAVSGIYSVLLDTLLCAIGPLLCLSTEIVGLEHLNPTVFKKTLDHISYFMPGL